MYKNKEKIEKWLEKYEISHYFINDDLSIDIVGSVVLDGMRLKKLPVQFGTVGGDFDIDDNQLENLQGCPHTVGGSFDCSFNNLVSLEGSPKFVGGNVDCRNNKLINLKYCPESVKGDFRCSCNEIITLEYYPRNIEGDFNCRNNPIVHLMPSHNIDDWHCNFAGNFQHFGSVIKELEGLYYYEHVDLTLEDIKKLIFKKELEDTLDVNVSNSRKNKI